MGFYPADQHAHRNQIRRVIVYQVDDTMPQQKIWAKGLYQEEIKFAYRNQDFGISTVPPISSEGYAYSLAGRPDQIYFIGTENPQEGQGQRPINKQPGESFLYDAFGNIISLHSPSNSNQTEIHINSQSGKVTVKGAQEVHVESATTVSIKAASGINIDGDINQTGNLTSTGFHKASAHI